MQVMETGIYGNKKPPIPKELDKVLYNNVQEKTQATHRTPLGAGMLLWGNDKMTLQPAIQELNSEKAQASVMISKTNVGNINFLIMGPQQINRRGKRKMNSIKARYGE